MIALFTLLALADSAAATPDMPEDEVVIVARKLSGITLSVGRDEAGHTTCAIDRSSGDVRLDDAMCRRAGRCLPRKPLPPAKFDACLDRQRAEIVAMARKGMLR